MNEKDTSSHQDTRYMIMHSLDYTNIMSDFISSQSLLAILNYRSNPVEHSISKTYRRRFVTRWCWLVFRVPMVWVMISRLKKRRNNLISEHIRESPPHGGLIFLAEPRNITVFSVVVVILCCTVYAFTRLGEVRDRIPSSLFSLPSSSCRGTWTSASRHLARSVLCHSMKPSHAILTCFWRAYHSTYLGRYHLEKWRTLIT